MKYLILGAGGTGGCVGAYLAAAGFPTTLIARGAHLAAIKKTGLAVKSARKGDFIVHPVSCCTMEEYRDSPDVIFVCVKYYSLAECIPFLQRVVRRDTVVIPLLNVFGTGDFLQPQLDCAVLNGCIYIYSMIEQPGVLSQPTDIFRVYFGCRRGQDDVASEKLFQIEADLRQSGIDAFFTPQIDTEALTKFSFVSPLGAAGVYFDACSGDFQTPGEKQDFFIELINEVAALGSAMQIALPEDLIERNLRLLRDMAKDGRTSMQRDLLQGGNSEFEGLVARVVQLSAQYGLPSPGYRRVVRRFETQ